MQGGNIPKSYQSAQWNLSSPLTSSYRDIRGGTLTCLNHHAHTQHCSQTGAAIHTSVRLTLLPPLIPGLTGIATGMKPIAGRVPVLLQGHSHRLCGLSGYFSLLCWLGTNISRWRARKERCCGQAAADAAEPRCLPAKRLMLAIA